MKIYGKQVFIGTKKICVDYRRKISGDIKNPIETEEYYGNDIENDVVFIKDKYGYYVDINDIYGSGFLVMHCYGAAQRLLTYPKNVGCEFIANLKPYFSENLWNEKFDLKTLIESIKSSSTSTID